MKVGLIWIVIRCMYLTRSPFLELREKPNHTQAVQCIKGFQESILLLWPAQVERNAYSNIALNPLNHQFMGFPQDNFYPGNLESFPGLFIPPDNTLMPRVSDQMTSDYNDHQDRKRKEMDITTPETSSVYSSPQGSENIIRKNNIGGRGKRVKGNGKDEKPREVVHVRAKRGQATDSHSLAERARRGKINERIKCLQDIVPGCCKSMGMAVMLDEIINYVQSLQNQVEFLSMKLTAASTLHDFNSDISLMETMQRAKVIEALKIENVGSQEIPSAQFAQLGLLNFGYFPHNL